MNIKSFICGLFVVIGIQMANISSEYIESILVGIGIGSVYLKTKEKFERRALKELRAKECYEGKCYWATCVEKCYEGANTEADTDTDTDTEECYEVINTEECYEGTNTKKEN